MYLTHRNNRNHLCQAIVCVYTKLLWWIFLSIGLIVSFLAGELVGDSSLVYALITGGIEFISYGQFLLLRWRDGLECYSHLR